MNIGLTNKRKRNFSIKLEFSIIEKTILRHGTRIFLGMSHVKSQSYIYISHYIKTNQRIFLNKIVFDEKIIMIINYDEY